MLLGMQVLDPFSEVPHLNLNFLPQGPLFDQNAEPLLWEHVFRRLLNPKISRRLARDSGGSLSRILYRLHGVILGVYWENEK